MEIAEEIVVVEPVEPVKPIREYIKNISNKSPTETNDNPNIWRLVLLRNTRNSYLQLTDKYLLSDFPIKEEKRNIIIEYRQYLRDFINNNQEAIMNGFYEEREVEIQPRPII